MAFGENSRHKLGRLQRSKSIPEAENAFARAAAGKGSRRKLPLLGQVRKSTKGAAGGGPTAETSRRKKALLVQYKHMKKSNRFVDRRFGGWRCQAAWLRF